MRIETLDSPSDKVLREIAALHMHCLAGDMLPRLGRCFLFSIYSSLAQSNLGAFHLIADDAGVSAVLVMTRDRKRLLPELLRRHFVRAGTSLIGALLRSPGLLLPIARTALYGSKGSDTQPVELLFLGVRSDMRNQGAGQKLLQEAQADLERRKIKSFQVVVGEKNLGARRFYERYGGKQQDVFRGGTQNLIRYVFNRL